MIGYNKKHLKKQPYTIEELIFFQEDKDKRDKVSNLFFRRVFSFTISLTNYCKTQKANRSIQTGGEDKWRMITDKFYLK